MMLHCLPEAVSMITINVSLSFNSDLILGSTKALDIAKTRIGSSPNINRAKSKS